MAYRFKLDEPIQSGFRRIGGEQIDRAITELDSANRSTAAVHEARKSLKRIRALLRLARPALGEATFTRENTWFRETGALLSHVRDAEILLETVIKLDARFPSSTNDALARLRKSLTGSFDPVSDPDAKATAQAEAAHRLRKAKTRFQRLQLDPDGIDALSAGLEQSFRRAGRAFERAYAEPSHDSVHDWRKGVQQHWRHMLLLRRAWPELADARMHAARKLSQILGDDHDLAILQHHLETTRPATFNARDVRTIARLAAQRQSELRVLAHPWGAQLFADSARSIGRRFATYWAAAQDLRALRAAADDGEDAAS